MDYAKSGDQELGMVTECHEWAERMDIGYWILDIRVGTGSNTEGHETDMNCGNSK